MRFLPEVGPPDAVAVAAVGARTRIGVWWAVSRLAVVATAFAVHALRRPHGYFDPQVARRPLALLGIWDGAWYRRVAEHGYLLVAHHQSDPAFFPLYPIFLRVAHPLGMSYVVVGIVISNVALLVGLVLFYELGRTFLPEAVAYRSATLAAVFPLGYVFSMVYPEALVFAALAAAGLLAVRGRWFGCAVGLAVATLARPEGLFMALPVAWIAASRWRDADAAERGRIAAAVLAGPMVFAAFPLYLGWTLHDAFAWNQAQTTWGRSFRVDGIVHAFATLPGTHHPWLYRDAAFCVVYVVLIAVAARVGVALPWLAMAVLIVVLPLATGSFESVGRFGVLALPVYWGLGSLARRPWVARAFHAGSLALLVAGTVSLKLTFP
jgi:hypothetical protein